MQPSSRASSTMEHSQRESTINSPHQILIPLCILLMSKDHLCSCFGDASYSLLMHPGQKLISMNRILVSSFHLACSAILNENEFMNTYTSQQDPYDQYEVSIPLEVAGDCMAKVQGWTHDQQARVSSRIGGIEDLYLSCKSIADSSQTADILNAVWSKSLSMRVQRHPMIVIRQ